MKSLVDASAFITLLKKATVQTAAECLQQSTILDLTYYEVGNGIWKESTLSKLLTPDQSKRLGKAVQSILASISPVTGKSENFQDILKLAKDEKVTFYDASYIFFAQQEGLMLITEDKQLIAKAQRYVPVQTVASLTTT